MISFSIHPRRICLWIHRYTGLVMAAFLIMAGITGALLAFHDELDDVFNQRLAYVKPAQTPVLSIATLHDKVISSYPEYSFSAFAVTVEPNRAVVFVVDKYKGDVKVAPEPPFQEVYINPFTAEIMGTRDKNEWAWRNTMYKVFWLHRDLLLGDIGKLILGIVALVWTLNCFIGFYLTFPRAVKNSSTSNKISTKKRASFFKRWLPAWKIRTKTNIFKLNYDVHQAFGLWLWIMLFVIAWSSVGFNLQQVYKPVMQVVVGLEGKDGKGGKSKKADKTSAQILPNTMPVSVSSKIGADAINDVINKANSIEYVSKQATIAAQKNGLSVQQLLGIRWVEEDKQWQMRFKTNKDIGKKGGASSITVNAKTGSVERVNFGYQNASFGNKTDQWLSTLHMGHIGHGIGHLAYQIFLALIGLAVAVLSGTGVYLWWKGRQQRLKMSRDIKKSIIKITDV
ncbi:PepSY domain-containing protein [Psychrobacter sp. DAB_AL32B]|uniref:PepSY-associated TM helix domain-containing protein n=1 Tax=Psychrobacter sp. DAB_AL32B TaxID=1028414 RepID=UPI000B7FB8AB|nr:PepSY-associated TM helix domain-containing protein [Psychrobacter sp. DAB_AL32B]OXL27039.1 peptidase [Psychrobacter sp. DAB_AL32B]